MCLGLQRLSLLSLHSEPTSRQCGPHQSTWVKYVTPLRDISWCQSKILFRKIPIILQLIDKNRTAKPNKKDFSLGFGPPTSSLELKGGINYQTPVSDQQTLLGTFLASLPIIPRHEPASRGLPQHGLTINNGLSIKIANLLGCP